MVYLTIILFAIAALGGVTLAVMKMSGRELPMPIVIGHGIFAACGLVALIIMVAQSRENSLMNGSLLLFLITAVGGFTLLSFHLRNKPHPLSLIGAHGLLAVISFIIFLISVLR